VTHSSATRGRRQDERDEVLRVEDSLNHALAADFCVALVGASESLPQPKNSRMYHGLAANCWSRALLGAG
jgi:hypothetical protein